MHLSQVIFSPKFLNTYGFTMLLIIVWLIGVVAREGMGHVARTHLDWKNA